MATYIDAKNIGDAWLEAYRCLMEARGHNLVNLMVNITDPLTEDVGIRAALERDLSRLRKASPNTTWHSVHTVANTIFPISLYHPNVSRPDEHFFDLVIGSNQWRPGRGRGWGTYIGRLVHYEQPDGSRVNQLSRMLELLRESRHWSDLYEASLTQPDESVSNLIPDADLHVIRTDDRRRRGGPCLAHMSLTALEGKLHLTAQYRRHSYVARAYGNFLGLSRLLNFLARESGYEVGTMLVVGTHAEVESVPGRRDLLDAATVAKGECRPIETSSRPLGSSWSDLDLPVR